MTKDCIFCAIIEGEIPSYKVYEDDLFIAILDRFPKCGGHLLIIPKTHAATILDLPENEAVSIMPLAKKLAAKLKSITQYEGLNILQNNGEAAGQTVNHLHVHLIPRFKPDNMQLFWEHIDPSPEEFAEMVEKLQG